MDQYPFFVFVFCGVFLPQVLCFPHGTPSIDCHTMLPHQGGEPQNSTPPYVIAISFDNYDPGNEIQVTLMGTAKRGFQGFHLQARELEGDIPIGSFKIIDPNTQALACHNVSNSAISHTNSEVKHKVTATWIAPSDTKSIQFRATFVQDSENFWVGVHSKTITPRHFQSASIRERRNRKKSSRILIEIECTKKGGTYSSSGGCVQGGSSGSSQTSYAIGQVGIINPQGSRGGCVPGIDGVYRKYGCRDGAASYNTGVSYGQSVSSGSENAAQKPPSYPDSKPYPPERHTYLSGLTNSGYGSIIHSQSSSSYETKVHAQSGHSFSGSSNIYGSQKGQSYGQGGQRGNPCDRSSSSYNIIICKLGPSSTSHDSNTNGQVDGSSSLGVNRGCGEGTSYDSNLCPQNQPSPQSSSNLGQGQSSSSQNTDGQSGSSSSGSNRPCGQGGESGSYISSGCIQVSKSGSSSNGCDPSSSNCAGSKVVVARDTSHALNRSISNGQIEFSTTNSSSADVQGGSFISFSNNSNIQGSSFLGPNQFGGQHTLLTGSSLGGSHSDGDGSSSLGNSQHGKQGSNSSEGGYTSSAGKQSSPGLLLLFSVLSAFAISSSVVPKWFI